MCAPCRPLILKKLKKTLAKKNDRDYDSLIAATHTLHRSLTRPQIQRMAPGVRLAGSLRVETFETELKPLLRCASTGLDGKTLTQMTRYVSAAAKTLGG
jgi:hypothetical protein